MDIQEGTFGRSIAVTNLSQHPPDRLVDEIVLVGDQPFRNLKCVSVIVSANERVGIV